MLRASRYVETLPPDSSSVGASGIVLIDANARTMRGRPIEAVYFPVRGIWPRARNIAVLCALPGYSSSEVLSSDLIFVSQALRRVDKQLPSHLVLRFRSNEPSCFCVQPGVRPFPFPTCRGTKFSPVAILVTNNYYFKYQKSAAPLVGAVTIPIRWPPPAPEILSC